MDIDDPQTVHYGNLFEVRRDGWQRLHLLDPAFQLKMANSSDLKIILCLLKRKGLGKTKPKHGPS